MTRARWTQARNHPRAGSSIKVEPIRNLEAIRHIKALLQDQPRNLCLFTLGINTAYRAGEFLSLTVGQVSHLRVGDYLDIKQTKTDEYRRTKLNDTVVDAIGHWLGQHPDPRPHMPLFLSARRPAALLVPSTNRLVKVWCVHVGLNGNYGSHSLRKTWAYHQHITFKQPIAWLCRAMGHRSERQTLDYIGIQLEEIDALYASSL